MSAIRPDFNINVIEIIDLRIGIFQTTIVTDNENRLLEIVKRNNSNRSAVGKVNFRENWELKQSNVRVRFYSYKFIFI